MINRVTLVGFAGKDPETRQTSNDKQVSNFSLATTETYSRNGEKLQDTQWHNIVAWNKLSEIAEKYIKKGQQLYIEGRIKTRSYESDGTTKYITEVLADKILMLGK